MPHEITFHYFYGRGIGEPIRLLLTIGGIAFEDRRYTFEEFANVTELKSRLPFGQIPALEIDGAIIGQTDSVSRYAARLAGLYPDDALEAARCDMVVVHQAEIQSAIAKMVYDGVPGAPGTKMFPPNEKARRINTWFSEKLPGILLRIENLAAGNTILGNGLSWADVAIFCRVNHLMETGENLELNDFPKIRSIYHHVAGLAPVQQWIAAHPDDYESYALSNVS